MENINQKAYFSVYIKVITGGKRNDGETLLDMMIFPRNRRIQTQISIFHWPET